MKQHHVYRLLLLSALMGAAFPCSAEDWRAFRGNMNRNGYSSETVSLPQPAPVWQCRLGGPVVSSPSVSAGVICIGSRDSSVYAIDAATGSVNWRFKTGGWVDASPLMCGDTVMAGSRDGHMYLLRRAGGDTLGKVETGLQLSSAGVTRAGEIVCGTGSPLNRFSVFSRTAWLDPWSVFFSQMSYSSPAVAGRMAVIGASDGNLYGVDLDEKAVTWRVRTKGDVYLSTPAIRDSIAYFAPGDYDHNVYAVNVTNGTVYWKSEDSVAGVTKRSAGMASQANTLDLGALRRLSPGARREMMLALGKTGGSSPPPLSLRKVNADAPIGFLSLDGGIKTSSVAVDTSQVYVIQKEQGYTADVDMIPVSRFTLLALDASTGAERWRFSEVRQSERLGYCSSPVVAGGKVFFGWGEGKLYALATQNGEKLWEGALSGHIVSSPAISNGRLYVATMNGILYAYDLNTTPDRIDFQRSTYCYPNPARGAESKIQIYVSRAAAMTMTLFNMAEKPVLRVSEQLPGRSPKDAPYTYRWSLNGVANGVYFAIIKVKYVDGGEDKKILKIAVLH